MVKMSNRNYYAIELHEKGYTLHGFSSREMRDNKVLANRNIFSINATEANKAQRGRLFSHRPK